MTAEFQTQEDDMDETMNKAGSNYSAAKDAAKDTAQ